jgi:two-component system sensor histidine kinase QseC
VTANFAGMSTPSDADIGLRTVQFQGAPWRVFTMRGKSHILVRIGERLDTRQDITRSLVIEHSLPLIIGLPLLALMISFAVRHGLRPLERLTDLLRRRTPGNREPVQLPDATSELRPLIDTLNAQFERLEDALEREQRFNADVAHELRTPLTAALIHLETAASAGDRAVVDNAMASAQQSLGRLERRVQQILELARLEAGAAAGQFVRCDLIAIVKETIEELAPLIADKDIAMSFVYGDVDAVILGHEASLMAMVRNLVENAMRYGRPGGLVEVTLAAAQEWIEVVVRDDGPGIPAARRAFVFDRFSRENTERNDGFGLGLNIVQRAVQRHDATVELLEPDEGPGLKVRVILPRKPPTAGQGLDQPDRP